MRIIHSMFRCGQGRQTHGCWMKYSMRWPHGLGAYPQVEGSTDDDEVATKLSVNTVAVMRVDDHRNANNTTRRTLRTRRWAEKRGRVSRRDCRASVRYG